MSPAPGWYHAGGDPADTVRYWDGAAWHGPAHLLAPAPAPAVQAVPPLQQAPTPTPAQAQPQRSDPANIGAMSQAPEQTVPAADTRPAWDPELLAEQAEATAAAQPEQAASDPYQTPDGWLPDIGRQLAELGPRVGARMIDVLIYVVLSVILGIAGTGYLLDDLIPAMVFYLYEVGLTMAQGPTVGKRAMGMTTIGSAGEAPPDPRSAALRALPVFATIVPGWMGLALWILILVGSVVHALGDPERRSLADRIGSTLVVVQS